MAGAVATRAWSCLRNSTGFPTALPVLRGHASVTTAHVAIYRQNDGHQRRDASLAAGFSVACGGGLGFFARIAASLAAAGT